MVKNKVVHFDPMTIIAITVVQDEAPIIEDTIRHLLAHRIDRVLVVDHRSTDGTRDVLARLAAETGRLDVEYQDGQAYYQPEWVNDAIGRAIALKPSWILPFDADEIFVPLTQPSLAAEFEVAGRAVLNAKSYSHASLERRASHHDLLGKRAFSWWPGVRVDKGAHNVVGHPGPLLGGRIQIRHRNYLSETHFIQKTRKHLASQLMNMRPEQSVHFKMRARMSDAQLREEYRKWSAVASEVFDPIPLRRVL